MTHSRWTLSLSLVLLASACKEPDPSVETNTTDDGTTTPDLTGTSTDEPTTTGPTTDPSTTEVVPTTGTPTTGDPTGDPTGDTTDSTTGDPTGDPCESIQISPIDESACEALASDYQPRVNDSKDDAWEACIVDGGEYTQVDAKVPGSVARIVAYETIADLLWRNGVPTKEDFTAARDAYITPEGLESRVVRRDDMHYSDIPMAEWDPQVDSDKQCTVEALWQKYPDRCVGPATLKPLLDEAFAAGQTGDGDPEVHAARIRAALDWFIYLSVYKEGNTCVTVKAADCDSAWAYYTGGQTIDAGIGIAGTLREAAPNTHERIWDGILAVRCWRDIHQDNGMYPLLDTLDDAAQDLFAQGWEQLDQALHRGFAVLVREQLQAYVDGSCLEGSPNLPAIWAYLQVTGPALQREADERDAGQAATLKALWAAETPTLPELEAGIAALDAIFPCP